MTPSRHSSGWRTSRTSGGVLLASASRRSAMPARGKLPTTRSSAVHAPSPRSTPSDVIEADPCELANRLDGILLRVEHERQGRVERQQPPDVGPERSIELDVDRAGDVTGGECRPWPAIDDARADRMQRGKL